MCYVYQYRFVTIERRVQHLNLRTYVVLYDFDPIRVRKERFARMSKLNLTDMPEDLSVLEDEVDGVQLVLNSTTSDPNHYLVTESPVVTGQNLPYVRTSRPLRDTSRSTKPVPLIDSERILIVRDASRPDGRHDVDVMQF